MRLFQSVMIVPLILLATGASLSDRLLADNPPPKVAGPRRPDAKIVAQWRKAGAYDGWLRPAGLRPDEPIGPDEPFGFRLLVFLPEELEKLPDLDQPFALEFQSTGRVAGGPDDPAPKLAALRHLKHLTILKLTGIGDTGLAALVDLPQLRDFKVMGNITDQGVRQLARLTNLTRLFLFDVPMTDDGAQQLARMKQLEILDLAWDSRVTDAGLEHLATLPNLKHLSVTSASITDKGLITLSKSRTLQELDLTRSKISDAGLEKMSAMENLRELDLSNTKISSDGMKHLARLPHLTNLKLSDTSVGDPGLTELVRVHELESLDVSGAKLTNDGLTTLATFSNLRWLDVGRNEKVTLQGLLKLRGLKHLKYLGVYELLEDWDYSTLNRLLPNVWLSERGFRERRDQLPKNRGFSPARGGK
jgi:Leucine-rich repeat (LRR) protein